MYIYGYDVKQGIATLILTNLRSRARFDGELDSEAAPTIAWLETPGSGV